MDLLHVIILAIVQGVTEFLPISSSAHLILPKELLGWPDQGLVFDVAVHAGSLVAVLANFYRDLENLCLKTYEGAKVRKANSESELFKSIVIATVPVCVAGFLFDAYIERYLRSTFVIAITTIVFGLLLLIAERSASPKRHLCEMSVKAAIIIGLFQCLALIPGTSRSGITITAALLLGFTAKDSARFSFLIAIPVIFLSGSFKLAQIFSNELVVDWGALGIGFMVSAISAYLCIYLFLSVIEKIGMLPFVIYRLLLGAFLLLFLS